MESFDDLLIICEHPLVFVLTRDLLPLITSPVDPIYWYVGTNWTLHNLCLVPSIINVHVFVHWARAKQGGISGRMGHDATKHISIIEIIVQKKSKTSIFNLRAQHKFSRKYKNLNVVIYLSTSTIKAMPTISEKIIKLIN